MCSAKRNRILCIEIGQWRCQRTFAPRRGARGCASGRIRTIMALPCTRDAYGKNNIPIPMAHGMGFWDSFGQDFS